jgi:23S rRNA (pseudouridine1915-N3)-methyltransferase
VKLHLIFVGKTRDTCLREGIEDYLGRLRRYVPVKVTIVRAEPLLGKAGEDAAVARESERVAAQADSGGHLVVLDRRGIQMTSEDLARWWSHLEGAGSRALCFALGGVLGFSEKLRQKADTLLSLSNMTFTHEMSRLLLLEQLYRARTILRGEKYHR